MNDPRDPRDGEEGTVGHLKIERGGIVQNTVGWAKCDS
jgi:hypothetical protein